MSHKKGSVTTLSLTGRIEALRELLVNADSYLSLLWHRHTPPEIKGDADLRGNVDRTIGQLRAAYEGKSALLAILASGTRQGQETEK